MYKKALLVVTLVPAVVFGAVQKESLVSNAKVTTIKSYVCQKYNDNHIDSNGEYIGEDSGVLSLNQTIEQTETGFNIKANKLFKEGLTVENPVGGSIAGLGGNETTIFFKREDDDRKTYFQIYKTNDTTGEIDRVIIIADCQRK